MKWHKGRDKSGKESDWFIYSDEGYKIAKFQVFKDVKYTAFAPRVNEYPNPLGTRTTSKECKELCEAHYVSTREKV